MDMQRKIADVDLVALSFARPAQIGINVGVVLVFCKSVEFVGLAGDKSDRRVVYTLLSLVGVGFYRNLLILGFFLGHDLAQL